MNKQLSVFAPFRARSTAGASPAGPLQTANAEILPPAKTPTGREPLRCEAVERIIQRTIDNNYQYLTTRFIRMDILKDATAVAVLETLSTGVRCHWTVSPETFELVNLGPIND